MKIVVDTNIVFSAILNSQSRIGQILLYPDKRIRFYSARYLKIEINNHLDKIKKITKLSDSEIFELTEFLYSKIHFISEDTLLKETILEAENYTKHIDFDDTLFVALSLHLKCKLWTGDKKLIDSLRIQGFNKFITTQELFDKTK